MVCYNMMIHTMIWYGIGSEADARCTGLPFVNGPKPWPRTRLLFLSEVHKSGHRTTGHRLL